MYMYIYIYIYKYIYIYTFIYNATGDDLHRHCGPRSRYSCGMYP